jgi:hypothetical protein
VILSRAGLLPGRGIRLVPPSDGFSPDRTYRWSPWPPGFIAIFAGVPPVASAYASRRPMRLEGLRADVPIAMLC